MRVALVRRPLARLASENHRSGRGRGHPAYSAAADIDGDGLVDGVDLAMVAARFGAPPLD